MHQPIDDLFARWKQSPDAGRTVQLCEALRGSGRSDLVEIVGSHAATQLDVASLLACARMYIDASRLDDAQTVLLAAGRLAPRDGDVFRWLGEVLLRRGDAERAEKVLDRAVQFGSKEPGLAALMNQAQGLVPTQQALGMEAVAQEMAKQPSVQVRVVPPATTSSQEDVETAIRSAPKPAPPPAPAAAPIMTAAFESLGSAAIAPAAAAPAASATNPFVAPPPSARGAGVGGAEPEIPMNPLLAAGIIKPAVATEGVAKVPEPRDVLDALQIAGIFEPSEVGKATAFVWEKAEAGKRRVKGTIALSLLAVFTIGGGIGTFSWVTKRRAEQHVVAEALLTKVDADLRTSDAKVIEPSEKAIGQAFELESRSPHAALTWLRERAMVGLLKGGENIAFEDPTNRAKEVGVPEKQIVFANVASFLFQGDTAGAAAQVAKYDAIAGEDPWFHLLAGATFERAGDPRALERYAAAVKLDPELLIAQILLARATAVDSDPKRGAELAKELRTKHPDRVEGIALVALAWARDPMRGEAPPEAKDIVTKGDALPPSLAAVAHASRAILALEKHQVDEAKAALAQALKSAETPGVAAWLGSIALATGDEALARKAALSAVSFSAVYPPARVLAARVALLGARLDEALKAAEDLPPSSPDVAVVAGAVAYEKVDGERMSRAFEAVPESARSAPFIVPLLRGQALLAGNANLGGAQKVLDMADDDEAPWADLVAMDWALDTGDLETAQKVASLWKGEPRAMRAVRLARLARYEGKLEDADKLSRIAVETGTVTPRVLTERVFTLVALKKEVDALALFKTYPNAAGGLAKWLRAYATAAHGKNEEARSLVSNEDPPPPLAPLPARMAAAAAYGAMKDARHGRDYTRALVQAGFANPDVAAASEKVGGGVVARPTTRRR